MPTVSVVLPVWNGERFLARAIESILLQTFYALELIVVDDGSTDATSVIAEEFARRDARVVVLHRKHEGFPRALNAGIAAARGRYVARMDADDVCLPARLERQIAYLEAHGDCVVVGAWVEVIDVGGHHVGRKTFVQSHAEITSALMNGLSPIAHSTVVARRDVLLAAGGYVAACYPSEDLDLWFRLGEFGQLANVGEFLLQYRRHESAVGVRERERQFAMTSAIVDEARSKRNLRPLPKRIISAGTNMTARYHFECARTALIAGPRLVALRHAVATIASEPGWLQAYVAFFACAVPRRMLRFALGLRRRLRRFP